MNRKLSILFFVICAVTNTGFYNLNFFKKSNPAPTPLKVIRTLPDGSAPDVYANSTQKIFFKTSDTTGAITSRVTDGTVGGTSTVSAWQATLPMDAVFVYELASINYFHSPSLGNIWRTDGTLPGTYALTANNTDNWFDQSQARSIIVSGTPIFYWVGVDPFTYLPVITETDGTIAGTRTVAFPGAVTWVSTYGAVTNGLVYPVGAGANEDVYAYSFVTHTHTLIKTIVGYDFGRGESFSNGSKFFFPLHVWGVGNYMFASDGTTAGTVQLETVTMMDNALKHVGTGSNGKEIFIGQATAGGGGTYRFYVSDGASVGDWTEIADTGLSIVGKSWYVDFAVQMTGKTAVRFYASGELATTASCPIWISDGTAGGTSLLASVAVNSNNSPTTDSVYVDAFVFGGSLYFQGFAAGSGIELWKYDGSSAPVILKNLDSGVGDSLRLLPQSRFKPVAVAGYFVFPAYSSTSGVELYRSDGTAGGTYLLKDINPGIFDGIQTFSAKALGASVVFAADNGTNGTEVWVTDGTNLGTSILGLFNQNPGASGFNQIFAVGGKLYFSARDDSHGSEPWVSDGTNSGTTLLKDIAPGSKATNPDGFSMTSNGVIFFGDDDVGTSGYYSIWTTDGTTAGTTKIVQEKVIDSWDIATAAGSTYFVGYDSTNGQELWKSDGTTGGTAMIKDVAPGANSTFDWSVDWIHSLGSLVLFSGNRGDNSNLVYNPWVTGGTAGSTQMLQAVNTGNWDGAYPRGGIKNGANLFYGAYGDGISLQLYMTDGTPAGSSLVKVINPSGTSDLEMLDGINGYAVFIANDGTNGMELWSSDGTAGGTAMIKSFSAGGLSSSFKTSVGKDANFVYFFVRPDSQDWQLWKTDGTAGGTTIVYTAAATVYPDSDFEVVSAGSYLFFSFCTPSAGCELWRSDKTGAGTRLFWDANPGTGSTSPRSLTYFSGQLYFSGYYHSSRALWATGLNAH